MRAFADLSPRPAGSNRLGGDWRTPRPAPEGFDALLARMVELVDAPRDAVVMPPGDERPIARPCSAPDGACSTFHVDDAAELIRIFDLIWIG